MKKRRGEKETLTILKTDSRKSERGMSSDVSSTSAGVPEKEGKVSVSSYRDQSWREEKRRKEDESDSLVFVKPKSDVQLLLYSPVLDQSFSLGNSVDPGSSRGGVWRRVDGGREREGRGRARHAGFVGCGGHDEGSISGDVREGASGVRGGRSEGESREKKGKKSWKEHRWGEEPREDGGWREEGRKGRRKAELD